MPKIPEYDQRVGLQQPPATPTRDYGLQVRAELAPLSVLNEATQAFTSLAGLVKRVTDEENTAASSELATKAKTLYQAGSEQNRAQHPDADAYANAQAELRQKIYRLMDNLSKNDTIKETSRMMFDNHVLPLRMRDAEEVSKKRVDSINSHYLNSINHAKQQLELSQNDEEWDKHANILYEKVHKSTAILGGNATENFLKNVNEVRTNNLMKEIAMTDGTPESEAAILKKYGARTLETPYGSIAIPGLNEAAIRKSIRDEMTYQHINADREWTESHRKSASNAAAAQVDLFNRLKGVSDENSLRDIVNSWEAELDGVQLVHEDRQKMLAWAKDVREKGAEDQIPVDSYESGLWYRAQMGQLSLTDLDKELSTKVGRGLSAKTAYAISVRVGGVAMAASKAAWGDAQQSLYAELVKKTSTSDFLTGVGISDAQMGAVNSAFRELHEEMARRPDATKTQILGIWQSLAEKYKDQALGRTGLPGKVIPGISLDNFYEKLLEEANTPGWTYRPEDWNATIRMVFPNPKNELDRTLIKHASSEVLKGAKSETEGKWEPGEDLTKGAKRKMK